LKIKDPSCWFDSDHLLKEFTLNLNKPYGLAFYNNTLYVTNYNDRIISKITANTDGTGTASTYVSGGLFGGYSLEFDSSGTLYVANNSTNTVSKITRYGNIGTITTYAASGLNGPQGLAFDSSGNLYVSNSNSNTVSKIKPNVDGTVTVIAYVVSGFNGVQGIAIDSSDNLYVANYNNNTISKVTANADGTGTATSYVSTGLNGPCEIAFDSNDNMYVTNYNTNSVSKVTSNGATGIATTYASGINGPYSLAFNSNGELYVGSYNTGTIYKINPNADGTGTAVTYASSNLGIITGLAFDSNSYLHVLYPASLVKSINAVCFNKGTKILCLNSNFKEEYVAIEYLKQGDLVKTYKHGYRKIDLIASGSMYNNPHSKLGSMYKMVKTIDNGLTDDLILTAQHSIMIDHYPMEMKPIQEALRILGFQDELDDKYLLFACLSKEFVQIEDTELYYYYHFILQNDGDDEKDRYGIYANGILAETPTKVYFLEQLAQHNLKLL
jgi:DNA-binding beta-propeller fold protein YncE